MGVEVSRFFQCIASHYCSSPTSWFFARVDKFISHMTQKETVNELKRLVYHRRHKTREGVAKAAARGPNIEAMPPSDGDGAHSEEGLSEKKSEAPKKMRKRSVDDTEGRRKRKAKPVVEVNSTFTDLRRLLQEMRPSTLQVLRTPYYRNCKAARNMRKGVRQIRDFCKQVRLETVMLAKKKQGEEASKKQKKKAETATPPSETGEESAKKRRKPATPPLESGEDLLRKKKKPELGPLLIEEEDDTAREGIEPEMGTPLEEEALDDESGGKSDGAASPGSPQDVTVDDEGTQEPEVSTPPIDLAADDDA